MPLMYEAEWGRRPAFLAGKVKTEEQIRKERRGEVKSEARCTAEVGHGQMHHWNPADDSPIARQLRMNNNACLSRSSELSRAAALAGRTLINPGSLRALVLGLLHGKPLDEKPKLAEVPVTREKSGSLIRFSKSDNNACQSGARSVRFANQNNRKILFRGCVKKAQPGRPLYNYQMAKRITHHGI
ncbi:hypothetical protein ACJ73_01078 [Blastomyces percursus]|uniref:Uncharacterized protein n=1 Tax=Blastomyces percursus TaxID=1658174 RepID=A0A1J9RHQ3_9EURO|nr:hypothetical protein ACJ73_01078 [Blastomyces percursus]